MEGKTEERKRENIAEKGPKGNTRQWKSAIMRVHVTQKLSL